MSWFSQFLGIDAANAQQEAIGKQQETAQNQFNQMMGLYNTNLGKMTGALGNYQIAANQQAGSLMSDVQGYGQQLSQLGQGLGNWYNQQAHQEFQGSLKDIFNQGRTQASQSGLIGGFQEGQNTAPAIAALGRSFATQQTDIARQNMMSQLGLGQQIYGSQVGARQQAGQWQLSPYAQAAQQYGSMAQSGLGAAQNAGQNYTSSLGNYSSGANPLGNLIGGVAGLASIFKGW